MDYRDLLFDFFAEDDGSLPEIQVVGLDAESAREAERVIRRHAVAPLRFAHVDGEAAPDGARHFVADLEISGVRLPEVGVRPEPELFSLDWRMGPGWTDKRIRTFLGLLRQIVESKDGAYLKYESGTLLEARHSFQKAWLLFLSEDAE